MSKGYGDLIGKTTSSVCWQIMIDVYRSMDLSAWLLAKYQLKDPNAVVAHVITVGREL